MTIDWTQYKIRSATGRIKRMETHEAQGRYDFTYDYAGRMLTAVNFGGQAAMNQSLTYDAAGSIRTNSRVGSYSYGAPSAAHPHAPTSVAGNSFTYDANGNMLIGPPPSAGMAGRATSYDGENRPASVVQGGLTTAYSYAADGTRLLRTEPSGKVTATFGPVEIRDFGLGTETVLTYPHPDLRLKNGTEVTWLHRDHLSSVRTMTNAAGARAAGQVYVPFGELVQIGTPLATAETKGFIGERYDSDAGLQYLNARYYDPKLGMFLQPDWFEVTKQGVGTNRYSYSFNDPVNKMDPGGNDLLVLHGGGPGGPTGVARLAESMRQRFNLEPVSIPTVNYDGVLNNGPAAGTRTADSYIHQNLSATVIVGFSMGGDAVLAAGKAKHLSGSENWDLRVVAGALVDSEYVSNLEAAAKNSHGVVAVQISGDRELSNDGATAGYVAGGFFGDRSYEAAVAAITGKYGSLEAFYEKYPNVVLVETTGAHGGAGNRDNLIKAVNNGIDRLSERDNDLNYPENLNDPKVTEQ